MKIAHILLGVALFASNAYSQTIVIGPDTNIQGDIQEVLAEPTEPVEEPVETAAPE